MPNTHFYGLIGDSHVSGNGASEVGTSGPVILGKSEQLISTFPLPHTIPGVYELAVNDIIEQVPFLVSIRARVIRIVSEFVFIVEPVAADAADTASGLYPTALPGPDDDPSPLWETWSQVNLNGAAAAWQITFYKTSQTAEQLNDESIERVTTQRVWWDPIAKKARWIDVDNYTEATDANKVRPGDRCIASNGAVFICVGLTRNIPANTARLFIVLKSGTLEVGNTLTVNQNSRNFANNVTITAIGAETTPGGWVQYCAMPSLGREGVGLGLDYITNEWEVPPRGNARRQNPNLGPDVKLVENMVAMHEQAPDVLDRGCRLFAYSSNDQSATAFSGAVGFQAGVTLQQVIVTSYSGTFAAGDTVTAGDWSAKVAGTNGTTMLYVYATNGETLQASATITATSGGTATAVGPALGWMPGSHFWNVWKAEKDAALSAEGALENGQAALWERMFLMIWEGEVSPYAVIGTSPGLAMLTHVLTNQGAMRKQWVDFAAALRDELGSPDMRISLWLHSPDAQSNLLSALGQGFLTAGIRSFLTSLAQVVPNMQLVDSHIRGHKMQSVDSGDANLFLRTLDYVDLGQAFWNGAANVRLSAAPGNYEILPVIVISGSQSQMQGFNVFNTTPLGVSGTGIAYFDKDPELWPSKSFVNAQNNDVVDTTDPNVMVWNCITQDLETYDVNQNENTFFGKAAAFNASGPLPPIVQRMKMRFGDGTRSGKIAVFKASVGGTALNPAIPVARGCWSPSLSARPSVTASCTITQSGGIATLTAAGAFASIVGNSDYTIRISGSAGVQGAGGNNSQEYASNDCFNITANSIQIADPGGQFAPGTETLTLEFGPPPLWPEMVKQWKAFVAKCVEKGYIPRTVVLGQDQGESDMPLSTQYAAQLDEFWDEFFDLCALREDKKDCDVAKFIVQMHAQTPIRAPLPTQQTEINNIRAAQLAKANALTNCVLVDCSPLPLEVNDFGLNLSSPPYPRTLRIENGVHLTMRAMIAKGYLIDGALGQITSLIPPHPKGNAAIEYGAVNSVASGANA